MFKLQTRISQAQRRGARKTVRKLQRLLLKSRSAKRLAVRRVTQDNRGKATAGVDGVHSLTPVERLDLADTLSLNSVAKPVRRVKGDRVKSCSNTWQGTVKTEARGL